MSMVVKHYVKLLPWMVKHLSLVCFCLKGGYAFVISLFFPFRWLMKKMMELTNQDDAILPRKAIG